MTTNPNSARQSLARAWFSQASGHWQRISQNGRNGWNAYAATQPRFDTLGQTHFLTGHQQFVAFYTTALNLGLTVPPLVPINAPPPAALATGFVVDLTASVWGMRLLAVTPIPALARLIIIASGLRSPGVNFERDFSYITNLNALSAGNALFRIPWTAKFGDPALGRKIFVRTQFFTALGGGGPVTQYSTIAIQA